MRQMRERERKKERKKERKSESNRKKKKKLIIVIFERIPIGKGFIIKNELKFCLQ